MKIFFRSFFLLLFFVLLFLIPHYAYADSNFLISFDITYTVQSNGVTHVVMNGSLENESDTYYATSYTLQLGLESIEHVSASDSKGAITPVLTKTKTGNTLVIPFNSKVYQLHKPLHFTVAFDTTDIAKHSGNIWEVNIPGIANQADFKDFMVHLHVPPSFGKPAYLKPAVSGNTLDFDKQILGNSGISVAFGDMQVLDFTLDYHVKNDNLFPITTEVALPPNTNYQDITMHDMTPKPTNVRLDNDGNWLATYYLFPSQKISVVAKGSAYLSLQPKQEKLSDQQKKIYLQEQPYWQTQNSEIKKLARDLKTPENIYSYVVHHLTYDFTRIAGQQERVGAEEVLKHPSSAVCLEFTDLFIALARAAGIPAREVDGYAYTQNPQQRPISLVKDVLHVWPEYYDKENQAWIMVDPTWENTTKGTDYFTTLDFDHLAFIIRGEKSTYPIPPGGYKFSNGDQSKDVFVTFGEKQSLKNPQVTVSFDIAPVLFAGFPVTGNLIFQNVSDRLVSSQLVNIDTQTLLPRKQSLRSQPIPPFGYAQLPVRFQNTSFLTNQKETITIRVAGNTITKTIAIYPFFFQKNYIIGGIISVIFCIGLLIFATRARRLSFFRRKR